jgi:hypothetical protein
MMAAVCLFAATAFAPAAVIADSLQNDKNTNRNIGIGGGAIALHGLSRGNGLETVIGVAGAAYGASQYEKDRKRQSAQSRARSHYHYKNSSTRRYYTYEGHRYYQNTNTGSRHRVD